MLIEATTGYLIRSVQCASLGWGQVNTFDCSTFRYIGRSAGVWSRNGFAKHKAGCMGKEDVDIATLVGVSGDREASGVGK